MTDGGLTGGDLAPRPAPTKGAHTVNTHKPAEIPAGTLAELYESTCPCPGEDFEPSGEVDGWRIIAATSGGNRRWREGRTLILRREADGQLFGCDYDIGLTNEYPWGEAKWDATAERYTGGGLVPCDPVIAATITKTVYRRACEPDSHQPGCQQHEGPRAQQEEPQP